MKIKLAAFALMFLLLTAVVAQTTTTSTSNQSGYCSDIFNNVHNIVSPAIYNATTFTGLLSVSFLIIIMVLSAMAIVYGIGYAFGIQSLVTFAKTEYIESFFNVLLLILIVGGVGALNFVGSFFSNAAAVGASAAPASGYGVGLYTALCNNILSTQVIGGLTFLVGTSLTRLAFSAVQNFQLSIAVTGSEIFALSFSFAPFSGLALPVSIIGLELTAVVIMMGMGVALIFLFFFIYFLFPIFLYLGILFRSFPWTRAAGGTFLALFIAFYLVFPAVFYPFTTSALASSNILASVCSGSSFTANPLCLTTQTNLLSYAANLATYLSASGASLLATIFSPTLGVQFNLSIYAGEITYFAMDLFGLFISFIVAYDLLEMLGDVLGAPSLQGNQLLSKIL
jgi:hypothetical protein